MVDEIFEKEYTYKEIFENLKNETEDDFKKIFSILNIESPLSKEDFRILIYHLTNHSTPVREMTAIKLEELSLKQKELFLDEFSKNQLLDATIDINPNVSRSICFILENSTEIQELIFEDLIKKTKKLVDETKAEFNKKEPKNKKSHAKNKKVFALYWYLEAISACIASKNNSEALEIVNFALDFSCYTIREKATKILIKMQNPPSKLLQKAKYDQNFYVKNLLYGKINYDE